MRTTEAEKSRKGRRAAVVVLALVGLGSSCARPVVDAGDAAAYGPLPDAVAEGWDAGVGWDDDGRWDEWTERDPAEPAEWADGVEWDEAGDWDDSEWDDGTDDGEPIARFSVDGDRLDPEATPEAAAIWKRFVQLIPADQRRMLVEFELLPESYGGAHVYPTDRDPSRWIMGIGLGLGNELDATLIHEFAHLLTLQANEVPPGSDRRGCTTYFTGEGCALSGSTFAAYVARFWPPSLIDEAAEAEQSGHADAIESFFEKHRDAFVTDYAATNPGEDLAETFTTFVMGDRPAGSTVADQKIAFLWNDPDMVALRSRIRVAV